MVGQDTLRSGQDQLVEQAMLSGDPSACLAYLDRLTEKQQRTARNKWLRVQCLKSGSLAKPNDQRLAAACLIACTWYVRDESGSSSPTTKQNLVKAQEWQEEFWRYFNHDGLRFKTLVYADLPEDQKKVLDRIERLLGNGDDYREHSTLPIEMESALQRELTDLRVVDLPMDGGESFLTYCLKYDLVPPLKTLLASGRIEEDRLKLALASAVANDAPDVTGYLMNDHFGQRDQDMENGLMRAAIEHGAHRVLQRWFMARSDTEIPGLRTWTEIAPRHGEGLAEAAFQARDTAFMGHVLRSGISSETLGQLAFRAMDAEQVEMFRLVLDHHPPIEAQGSGGMCYLHKALSLDSPDMLKALYDHDLLDDMAGLLDADGLPAVHYLAHRDLPNILAVPDLLAHLNMDVTDQSGFGLLHKIIFRPVEMAIPSEKLLKTLLQSNPKADRNKPGPFYDWTALHYAAREGRLDLVQVLIDNKASKFVKDSWKRTPGDVAKEWNYRKVVSAL